MKILVLMLSLLPVSAMAGVRPITQPSSSASSTSGVYNSSFTIVPRNQTTTNTTFTTCLTGSSVTVTISGTRPVFFKFSGSGTHGTTGGTVALNPICSNGTTASYVVPNPGLAYTATRGMFYADIAVGTFEQSFNFNREFPAGTLASGSQTCCLAPRVSGGTMTIGQSASSELQFGFGEK